MIVVVSGLPRSGTSMMMQMLAAGGMPVLVDDGRPADDDNPLGYYECRRTRRLAVDASWLDEAEGKAIKVVSPLLEHLPASRQYRIVFMLRGMDEVLRSQAAMLRRRGTALAIPDDGEMAAHFEAHLAAVRTWLGTRRDMAVLWCGYDAVLADPLAQSAAVVRFLGLPLDAASMAEAVRPDLCRHRLP